MFDEAFLLANSSPEPNTGCWLWTGKTHIAGYGRYHVNGKDYLAHRIACEVATGKTLTRKDYACHRCNVRLCVNPSHIYAGDFYSNMRDMADSGAQKGERNPSARLMPEDVHAIRADTRIMKHIAADYGVHPATIQAIKTGRSWQHI